jgi:hypothetical protein
MTTKCKYEFIEDTHNLCLWFKDDKFVKGLFISPNLSFKFKNYDDILNLMEKEGEGGEISKFIKRIMVTTNFKVI